MQLTEKLKLWCLKVESESEETNFKIFRPKIIFPALIERVYQFKIS